METKTEKFDGLAKGWRCCKNLLFECCLLLTTQGERQQPFINQNNDNFYN